jgi:hypothetical protein
MTGAIFVVVCGVLVEAIDGTVVGDTVHSEG